MSSSLPYDPSEVEDNPFASEPSRSPVSHTEAHENETRHINEHDDQEENNNHTQHQYIAQEDEEDDNDDRLEETAEGSNGPYSADTTTEHVEPPSSIRSEEQEQPKPQLKPTVSQDSKKVKKYKLITKVTGLERQGKKDPIIRFDAYSTLPRFRTTTFKDIRRTHHEFVKFFEHLNGNNPECFVPSIPPATTSAGAGTEEDETKVKFKIQQWLDRVTSNPILARDEEFIYFIEADFGYSPVVKRRPPATGLTRKAMKQFAPPHDETELAEFRPLIKSVYVTGTEASAKLEKVTKHRRSLGLAENDFGSKIGAMGELEQNFGMINMWRKLGKVIMTLGDLEAIKATAEAASLGDGIAGAANDGFVAKEAMTNRHLLMKELLKAQTSTKSKHQTAMRVRGSQNLSPTKVDEAITALEDATQHEERLTNKVRRVTDNMLLERSSLLSRFETDLRQSVGEYTLRMIESERRALSTWESVRLDVRAVDANGGLSRLGRESTPANRRAALAASQGPRGDSWAGDRRDRAPDYIDTAFTAAPKENDEHAELEEETTVDARNAASLLAGSTF